MHTHTHAENAMERNVCRTTKYENVIWFGSLSQIEIEEAHKLTNSGERERKKIYDEFSWLVLYVG